MKKKFWTGRLKTILIVALIIAICAAVTLAITNGTSAIENVVGTILPHPCRRCVHRPAGRAVLQLYVPL